MVDVSASCREGIGVTLVVRIPEMHVDDLFVSECGFDIAEVDEPLSSGCSEKFRMAILERVDAGTHGTLTGIAASASTS